MRIRLTQAGFESYTGQMGIIMFENGMSVTDVLPNHAKRIAAVIGADWEDGSSANVGDHYMQSMHMPAPMPNEQREQGKDQAEQAQILSGASAVVYDSTKDTIAKETKADVLSRIYTSDELAAIADDKGIAGLREVAKEFDVKGNSIHSLIDGIMAKMPTLSQEGLEQGENQAADEEVQESAE